MSFSARYSVLIVSLGGCVHSVKASQDFALAEAIEFASAFNRAVADRGYFAAVAPIEHSTAAAFLSQVLDQWRTNPPLPPTGDSG